MFATHAAAELDDEIGDFVGHILHDLDVTSLFRINERPDVQTSDAGVSIVAGARIVFVNDVPEANEEFRKLGGFHSAVLNERDRLPLTLHAKQKAKACFSYFPDTRLCGGIEGSNVGIS